MALNMAKENGKVEEDLNAINMKVTIKMIKNMDSVFFNGPVVTVIKENTKKMKEMVMEK